MKAKGFFRKFNFLIALGGVFAAVAFYGCGNLFSSIDSASDSPANLAQPREGYGILSGSLPSSDSASARTAMPSKPDETALSFKVFAQSGAQRIEANVNDADRTFSLSLPFGTWEITANGMLADGRIIFTQTQTVTLSEENATAFLRFELGYSTNPDDGDGEISLSVSFPPKSDTSAIRGIEYVLSRGEEKIVQNVSDAELGAGKFKIGLATENLGAWHLTILFYGDFSNLVYRIDQTVNVYANLTTDTFEGSAPYISGGAIAVTQALLEDFQNTTLYVNATSGKDTNTGTQFDPLQTFNRALELVNNSTRDANTEFRIFLQTDVADGATLELKSGKKLTVASAGADDTTRTITSLGRTFTVSSGSELTVQSVACKKLRFDVAGTFTMDGGEISGNTADNGGAICINAGGKATIANTKIHDNTADTNGGGVYVTGGAEFTMSSGTIHNNTAVGSSGGVYNEGTFIMTAGIISTNTATYNGGGVYVNGSGIFTMNGGEISNNTSTYAGGVFVRNNGTFTMKGGTILRNIVSATGGGVSVHTGTVEIKDGTIENNTAAYGGGIFVGNFANTSAPTTFKMDGGTVSGNNASGDGGGVAVNSGTFTIDGGEISGNTASNGGAIYIATTGKATIANTKIHDNTAHYGGGVYVNGTFELKDSGTISGNSASQDGGGVYVNGDASTSGMFTMKNGTISGNKALDSSNGSGGGVYINNGTFIMEGGKISKNKAKDGGGGISLHRLSVYLGGNFTLKGGIVDENEAEYGGGIWAGISSTFIMENGTFSGNKSTGNGNGAYIYPGCTFKMSGEAQFAEDNDVYLYASGMNISTITVAGALTAESPVATITPSAYDLGRKLLSAGGGSVPAITPDICKQFALTSAPDDDTVWKIAPSSDGANGVLKKKFDIYVRGNNATWYEANKPGATASDSNLGDLEHPFSSIQMAVSEAISQNDGADEYTIFVDGTLNGSGMLGSGGMADFSALTQDLNLTIKALSETEKATLDGGARFDASSNVTNPGIGKRVIYAIPTSGTLNLTLENLVITGGNTATYGGGIDFVSAGGSLTMTGCAVRGNEAGYGGGVYGNGGTVTMEGSTISGNTATTSGGGVFINGSAFTMESGTISGNRANTNGGGVYVKGSTFTMESGTISDNTATEYYGGGVHIESGTFTMSGGTMSGNTANLNGGGVYVIGGTFAMSGGTISKNIANSDGGGIFNASTFTMTGGAIENNEAKYGGGVLINGGTFTMSGGTAKISGNTAKSNGGGVFVYNSGEFTMGGGTVSDNTANSDGGGVFNASTVKMTGGTIENNEADSGGGVLVSGGSFTMSGGATKISNNKAKSNGGGVFVYNGGEFTMSGGTLSENTAKSDGGGVYNASTVTMEDGTISGNEANYGGGVYVIGGTFTMSGSASAISGNTARGKVQSGGLDGGGGGVYLNGATFTMSGGSISGNKTAGSLANSGGGGIYAYNKSTFTMEGGRVSGNKAENGEGAFVSPDCAMNMSGAAKFEGDNDVYLYNYPNSAIPTICVTGTLSASSVATITPSDYTAGRQVLSAGTGVMLYNYGCNKFAVTPDSDGADWSIAPDAPSYKAGMLIRPSFYVRGSGAGWYAENPAFTASAGSDTTGKGSKTKPFATIQKAIDEVIAQKIVQKNDVVEYTIYVDGTLTLNDAPTNGMADFSASNEYTTLTITALSETTKATLDANKKSRVIYADPKGGRLTLTMKNLIVTNGKIGSYSSPGRGGGIYWDGSELTIDGCTISENEAVGGSRYQSAGGGIYSDGRLIMDDCIISKNTAANGGGIYNADQFIMHSGSISGNEATDGDGGGFYNDGSGASYFVMEAGTISGNTASGNGGGVCDQKGKFTQTGGTVSGNTPDDIYQP